MKGRCLILSRGQGRNVFADIYAGLAARGWDVTSPGFAEQPDDEESWLARRIAVALADRRRIVRTLARGARRARAEFRAAAHASAWFREVDTLLREPWDVVFASTGHLPIGATRLITSRHPRVVVFNMVALQRELDNAPWLGALRAVARVLYGRSLHPDVMRPVDVRALRAVVCPSTVWRDEAVAAGVPADVCRVIPIGVPVPASAPPRPALGDPARLLWAARLSPEKGLHLFLAALPLVLRERAVTLDAVALEGPAGYRDKVTRQIAALGLDGVVRLRPAMPRPDLIRAFDEHDLLLFHSVFGEPVAQVMLHAAAAGLPMVGPASARAESVLNAQTASCYVDTTPERIAAAILESLADEERRLARAARLRAAVQDGHSFQRTIDDVDALLTAVAAGTGDRLTPDATR